MYASWLVLVNGATKALPNHPRSQIAGDVRFLTLTLCGDRSARWGQSRRFKIKLSGFIKQAAVNFSGSSAVTAALTLTRA